MAATQVMDCDWEEGNDLEDEDETLKGYLIEISPETGDPFPDGSGKTFQLYDNEIKIGRRPENTIVLNDATVSGNHAKIKFEQTYATIEDLGSTNKTSISRHAIIFGSPFPPKVKMQLTSKLYIKFGDAIYRFLNREDFLLLIDRDVPEEGSSGEPVEEEPKPGSGFSFMEEKDEYRDLAMGAGVEAEAAGAEVNEDEATEEALNDTVVVDEESGPPQPAPTQVVDDGEAETTDDEDLFRDLDNSHGANDNVGPAPTQVYEADESSEEYGPAPTQAYEENEEDSEEGKANVELAPTMQLDTMGDSENEEAEEDAGLNDLGSPVPPQPAPTQIVDEMDEEEDEEESLGGLAPTMQINDMDEEEEEGADGLAPTMQIGDSDEGEEEEEDADQLAPTMQMFDNDEDEEEGADGLAPTMHIGDFDEDENHEDDNTEQEQPEIAPTMIIGGDDNSEEEEDEIAPTMVIADSDEDAEEEIAPTMVIADPDQADEDSAEEIAPTMVIGEPSDGDEGAEDEIAPTMVIGGGLTESEEEGDEIAPTMVIGDAGDENTDQEEAGIAPTMKIGSDVEATDEEPHEGEEIAPTLVIGENAEPPKTDEEPAATEEEFLPTMQIEDEEEGRSSPDLFGEKPEPQRKKSAAEIEAEEDKRMEEFMEGLVLEDENEAEKEEDTSKAPQKKAAKQAESGGESPDLLSMLDDQEPPVAAASISEPSNPQNAEDEKPAQPAEDNFPATMQIDGFSDEEENQPEEPAADTEDDFPATMKIPDASDEEDSTEPPENVELPPSKEEPPKIEEEMAEKEEVQQSNEIQPENPLIGEEKLEAAKDEKLEEANEENEQLEELKSAADEGEKLEEKRSVSPPKEPEPADPLEELEEPEPVAEVKEPVVRKKKKARAPAKKKKAVQTKIAASKKKKAPAKRTPAKRRVSKRKKKAETESESEEEESRVRTSSNGISWANLPSDIVSSTSVDSLSSNVQRSLSPNSDRASKSANSSDDIIRAIGAERFASSANSVVATSRKEQVKDLIELIRREQEAKAGSSTSSRVANISRKSVPRKRSRPQIAPPPRKKSKPLEMQLNRNRVVVDLTSPESEKKRFWCENWDIQERKGKTVVWFDKRTHHYNMFDERDQLPVLEEVSCKIEEKKVHRR